jgi:hypothetical protein
VDGGETVGAAAGAAGDAAGFGLLFPAGFRTAFFALAGFLAAFFLAGFLTAFFLAGFRPDARFFFFLAAFLDFLAFLFAAMATTSIRVKGTAHQPAQGGAGYSTAGASPGDLNPMLLLERRSW